MDEGDALALRSDARCLIDEAYSCRPAAVEHFIQVIDRVTDVMDGGPPPPEEFSDRRVVTCGLEELDQRLARGEGSDPCTVAVGNLDLTHSQHIAIEGEVLAGRFQGDADVGDPGAFRVWSLH